MGFLQRAFGGGGTPQGENILSSLASPPVKALQVAGSQVGQQYDPSMSEDRYAPAAVQPTASADAPREARPRRSTMETIGLLGDLIARAQGGPELYQPFQDAAHARDRLAIQEPMQDTLNQQKIEAGQSEIDAKKMSTLGQALGAIGDDPTMLDQWPAIAETLKVDPTKAAQMHQIMQRNPAMIKTLARSMGYKPEAKNYGSGLIYAKDDAGNDVLIQPGLNTEQRTISLPSGTKVAPKPEALLSSQDRRDIADGKNRTTIQTAKMRAAAQKYAVDNRPAPGGAKAGKNSGSLSGVEGNLKELEDLYSSLRAGGDAVSPSQNKLQNVLNYARSSGIGQVVEGALGTDAQTSRDRIASLKPVLLQSITKALGVTAAQLNSNVELQNWMKTVTNPSSSAEANRAAIDGIRRFVADSAPKEAPAARANVQPRRAPGGGGGKTLVYNPKTGKIE